MTTGVLLLHGSSGRPDQDRVRVLEAAGYEVVAPRWFDERISEIPLESFPLDDLAARHDRLAVIGISRGAEAALLLGTVDERVDVVVGLSPSAYSWAWIENGVQTSPWTWQGEPLPFVPFDLSWQPDDDPPSYVEFYRQSLRTYADQVEAARIPAERFRGELLLVAGGDDRLWPSVEFAEQIALRRGQAVTQLLISGEAGHRPLFPGEEPKTGGLRMARGGSDEADRAFGAQTWPHILRVLAG
ncbi:BAAT/Acyl-CoA thioester hydrolase [Kribbella flavida DSM 17836]|uniref:BAAT/Acyl-CoA thioester hydrolase n=1 Tax=Kribbella flavida (strain DSM 17836 / JCM 10339 / NBRC 14399) TaxID=479435 RepID=D2PSX5_KRIFD|nr:acyl-CoA thioester hydrolase/BAAT C-terminal domain-containing protein [Kribbella flavida]ADB35027.1 BAAT/Acyl-CoA thioester hydrolase [Kribbella flavida DSM 17836]